MNQKQYQENQLINNISSVSQENIQKLRKTLYPKEYKGRKEKSFSYRLQNDKFEEMINVFEDDKSNFYMGSEDRSNIETQQMLSQNSINSEESSPQQKSITGKSMKSGVSKTNNNNNVVKVEYNFLKSYAFPENLDKPIKTENDLKDYGREIDPQFNQKLNENLQSRYKVLKTSENIVDQFNRDLKQEKIKNQRQKKQQYQYNSKNHLNDNSNKAYVASNEKFKFPQNQRIRNDSGSFDNEQENYQIRKKSSQHEINSQNSSSDNSPNTQFRKESFFQNPQKGFNSSDSPNQDLRNRVLSKMSNYTDFNDQMSSSIDMSMNQSNITSRNSRISKLSRGLSMGRKKRSAILNNEQSLLNFQNKIRNSFTYSDLFNNQNSDNFDQLPENIDDIYHTLYDREKKDLNDKQGKINRVINSLPVPPVTNKHLIDQMDFKEKLKLFTNYDHIIGISHVTNPNQMYPPLEEVNFHHHLNYIQRDMFTIQDPKIQELMSKNERKHILDTKDVIIDQNNLQFEDMMNILSNRIPIQNLKQYLDPSKIEQNVKDVIVDTKEIENLDVIKTQDMVETLNDIEEFKKSRFKNQLKYIYKQKNQVSVSADAQPEEIIQQTKTVLDFLTEELKTIKNAVQDAKSLPYKFQYRDQILRSLEEKYETKVYEIVQHILHPEMQVYPNYEREFKEQKKVVQKEEQKKNIVSDQKIDQEQSNNVIIEVSSRSDSFIKSQSQDQNQSECQSDIFNQNDQNNNNFLNDNLLSNQQINQDSLESNYEVLKIEKEVLLKELQELIADEKRVLNSKIYGEKMSSVLYQFYYDFDHIINMDKQRKQEQQKQEEDNLFQELEKLQEQHQPFYMRDYKKGSEKLRKLNEKNLKKAFNR